MMLRISCAGTAVSQRETASDGPWLDLSVLLRGRLRGLRAANCPLGLGALALALSAGGDGPWVVCLGYLAGLGYLRQLPEGRRVPCTVDLWRQPVSYEATIVCDKCSAIIAAANTAADARAENRHAGGRSHAPWDLCQRCVALGTKPPSARQVETGGEDA